MASDYARALGARLRAIRTQQGLSLHGVEEKSEGRWKAVVVGSYERGDRAVTVQRLSELAVFYGDPNLINTTLAKVETIGKNDIQRVAKTYLTEENRTVITTLPKPKTESAAKAAN